MDQRPVGDTGWLLAPQSGDKADDDPLIDEVDAAAALHRLAGTVRAAGLPLIDVVPAARTVLVTTTPGRHAEVGAALARLAPQVDDSSQGAAPASSVTLSVVFDGEDLAGVAALVGVTPAALVAHVVGVPWLVAFGGFAPGFAYLVGGGLDVPRLASPRPQVRAGSLALAGPYAAVYPDASPGGWRLVGRVVAAPDLFDADRDPPALLGPGGAVRFVSVS